MGYENNEQREIHWTIEIIKNGYKYEQQENLIRMVEQVRH